MEDYEIHDGDSDELKTLKSFLKYALTQPVFTPTHQERNIEILKFNLKVYCAVDNLFKTELSKPTFQLVQSDKKEFELEIVRFGPPNLNPVPEDGLPMLNQRRRHEINFLPQRIAITIPRDPEKQDAKLDWLIASMHEYFNPTIIQLPTFRGRDEPLPQVMDYTKRVVHFVDCKFKSSAEFGVREPYIAVEFYEHEVDPVLHSEEHEVLLIWAENNRPKSIK